MFDLKRFKNEKISLHSRNADEFAAIVRFLKTTDVNIHIRENSYNDEHTDFVINWGGNGEINDDNRVKYGPADFHQGLGWKVMTVDELRIIDIETDLLMGLLES